MSLPGVQLIPQSLLVLVDSPANRWIIVIVLPGEYTKPIAVPDSPGGIETQGENPQAVSILAGGGENRLTHPARLDQPLFMTENQHIHLCG